MTEKGPFLNLFLWITSQKPTFRLTIKFYIELKEVTTKWCTYRQQSSQIFSYIWKSDPQVKHIKQVHQVFPGEHISHVYTLWFLYCCDCSIVRVFFCCRRVTLRIKNKAVSQTVYTKLGQKVTTFSQPKKSKTLVHQILVNNLMLSITINISLWWLSSQRNIISSYNQHSVVDQMLSVTMLWQSFQLNYLKSRGGGQISSRE